MNIQRIKDDKSLMRKILEKFEMTKYVRDDIPKTPVYKYSIAQNENFIDHSTSVHSDGLQKSKYLVIESDMEHLK